MGFRRIDAYEVAVRHEGAEEMKQTRQILLSAALISIAACGQAAAMNRPSGTVFRDCPALRSAQSPDLRRTRDANPCAPQLITGDLRLRPMEVH